MTVTFQTNIFSISSWKPTSLSPFTVRFQPIKKWTVSTLPAKTNFSSWVVMSVRPLVFIYFGLLLDIMNGFLLSKVFFTLTFCCFSFVFFLERKKEVFIFTRFLLMYQFSIINFLLSYVHIDMIYKITFFVCLSFSLYIYR